MLKKLDQLMSSKKVLFDKHEKLWTCLVQLASSVFVKKYKKKIFYSKGTDGLCFCLDSCLFVFLLLEWHKYLINCDIFLLYPYTYFKAKLKNLNLKYDRAKLKSLL